MFIKLHKHNAAQKAAQVNSSIDAKALPTPLNFFASEPRNWRRGIVRDAVQRHGAGGAAVPHLGRNFRQAATAATIFQQPLQPSVRPDWAWKAWPCRRRTLGKRASLSMSSTGKRETMQNTENFPTYEYWIFMLDDTGRCQRI